MAEQVYEGMFILDSNRFAREAADMQKLVEGLIQDAGGELLVSRIWEERRLAYPIENHRKGVYWLTYFRVSTDKLQGMNRFCQINDAIVRHMFLKIHPKLVEPIIAHASGEVAEATAPTTRPTRGVTDIIDVPEEASAVSD